MKIKISDMTGKLKGIPAINTNPLSNEFCKTMNSQENNNIICSKCYSCSMLKTYRKNCVPAFEKNSIILSTDEIKEIPKIKKNNIVRINAHGELINDTHLNNLIKIIDANPNITFSLYTKRKDLISNKFDVEKKPSNLILVYSNPIIDTPIETIEYLPYFDKVFNVCRDKYRDKINCGANNCNACRKCYDKGKENIIYEMLK